MQNFGIAYVRFPTRPHFNQSNDTRDKPIFERICPKIQYEKGANEIRGFEGRANGIENSRDDTYQGFLNCLGSWRGKGGL